MKLQEDVDRNNMLTQTEILHWGKFVFDTGFSWKKKKKKSEEPYKNLEC